MGKIKIYLLAFLSFALLITSVNIMSSNEIHGINTNTSEHLNARERVTLNDIETSEAVNEVSINESTNEDETLVDEVIEELKAEENTYDVNSELTTQGYEFQEEMSDDLTHVYKKGLTYKVIAYEEEVEKQVVTVRSMPQGIINEDNPYKYRQGNVELSYYVDNETLTYVETVDNNEVYASSNGFVTTLKKNSNGTVFSHTINEKGVTIDGVFKLLSDHTLKFEEDSTGKYLKVYDGDTFLTSILVATNRGYLVTQDDEEQHDFSNFEFEIDEDTGLARVKLSYDEAIDEELDGTSKYVVEYATFENVRSNGITYMRGTRLNGPTLAYPSTSGQGYVNGPSNIVQGAGGQPHYVRVGKNIESFVGGGFSSINTGYYEDKTNYESVINSLPVDVRLIDASLNIKTLGAGATASGNVGFTIKDYFTMSGYTNVPDYAKESTYYINDIQGNFNSLEVSHDNVADWVNNSTVSMSAAGSVHTTIGYDASVGVYQSFDVSNAVARWIKQNDASKQFLQVTTQGPDQYFATRAFMNQSSPAYIEMTFEEMPDFERNPYPMNETTINLRSFTRNNQDGAVTNVAIGLDGLTTMDALVKYEIYEKKSGDIVESGETKFGAQNTYAFPMYTTDIDGINNYYLVESNYQVESLIPTADFDVNKVYGVRVMPYFENGSNLVTDTGAVIDESDSKYWYEGDTFQIYSVGYQYEVFDRILNFYGRETDSEIGESYFDNNMLNPLISEKNRLFIRNPKKNAGKPYVQPPLTDKEKYLIDQTLMGMGYECEFGFEPINFNTGNFVYSSSDALIHSGGSEIEFTRFYNALENAAPGSFGRKWSSTIDYRMQILNNGSVVFKDESGAGHVITKNSDETYNKSFTGYSYSRESFSEQVMMDSDYYSTARGDSPIQSPVEVIRNNHIFTSSSGDKYYFNDSLKLEKIVTYNGEVHSFVNGFYGVEKYILPDSKEIEFIYNSSGFVEEIKFEDGTSNYYEYDSNENLISYTDQSGVKLIYNYESSDDINLMTSYESNGVVFIENEYDDELRVVKQTDVNGNVSKLKYENGYTILTDNNGNEFEVHYNELGHTTKVVRNGVVEEKIYDDKSQVIQRNEIDALGNKLSTFYEYNNDGQIVKTIYPDGHEATFEYNGLNLVKTVTPSEEVLISYDSFNNVTSTVSNGEEISSNTYDALGNMLTSRNEHGGVTTYTYYSDNSIKTIESPLGYTTSYEYDELGFMTKKTDELGQELEFERSERGEMTKVTFSDGSYESYEYNDFGNMIAKKTRDEEVFNFEYDELGNHTKTITAHFEMSYEYDGNRNLVKEVDANGNVTTHEYNSLDQVIKTTYPNGQEEYSEYDDSGNLIKTYDDIAITAEYEYDVFGNTTRQVVNGVETTFVYSNNKLISKYTNGILEDEYRYNSRDDITHRISSTGVVNESEYDSKGILRSATNGENTDEYTYNASGNIVETTNSLGHITSTVYGPKGVVLSQTDVDGIETVNTYDKDGNKLTVTVGGILTETNTYTPGGKHKTRIDALGNTTTYYYDEAGRVEYIVDALGNITSYKLDGNGNKIEVTDELGNTTKYVYDSMNRLVKQINAKGDFNTVTYDKRGNVIETVREDGAVKTTTYDEYNNVIEEVSINGVVITHEYEDNKLKKAEDSEGLLITYEYDSHGRMVKEASHGLETETVYDKHNRAVEDIAVDARIVYSEHDVLGRVVKSIDEYGSVKEYEYTPSGKTFRVIYEDSTFETYEYDVLGNEIKMVDRLGNISLSEYDNNSNLISETDALGNTVEYEYDALNNLTKTIDAFVKGKIRM